MDALLSSSLFSVGIILLTGYFASWGANAIRLPRISGYLVAGILLSPTVLGVLNASHLNDFSFVTPMALSVIAFSIGGSLQMFRLRELGGQIIAITLAQGAGAVLLAGAAVWVGGLFTPVLGDGHISYWPAIIVLGAISAATAPAATMAVINESQARGPLTTTLLGVVALDDALTIILFAVAVWFAGILNGSHPAGLSSAGMALTEVIGALVLGLAGGLSLSWLLAKKKRPAINLLLILGVVLVVGGGSIALGLSPLLSNMAAGFTLTNRLRHAEYLFHQLGIIEESIFCLFFVLAGAHFDFGAVGGSALLGAMLLLGRMAGKYLGAKAGAHLSGASKNVRRYLGITLLPQAGLSLGLIIQAKSLFTGEVYDVIFGALLLSVLFNELFSPPLVKLALEKSGEKRS